MTRIRSQCRRLTLICECQGRTRTGTALDSSKELTAWAPCPFAHRRVFEEQRKKKEVKKKQTSGERKVSRSLAVGGAPLARRLLLRDCSTGLGRISAVMLRLYLVCHHDCAGIHRCDCTNERSLVCAWVVHG